MATAEKVSGNGLTDPEWQGQVGTAVGNAAAGQPGSLGQVLSALDGPVTSGRLAMVAATVTRAMQGRISPQAVAQFRILVRKLQERATQMQPEMLGRIEAELQSPSMGAREVGRVAAASRDLAVCFAVPQTIPAMRVSAESLQGASAHLRAFRAWRRNCRIMSAPLAVATLYLVARFVLGSPGVLEGLAVLSVMSGLAVAYVFGVIRRDLARRLATKAAQVCRRNLGGAAVAPARRTPRREIVSLVIGEAVTPLHVLEDGKVVIAVGNEKKRFDRIEDAPVELREKLAAHRQAAVDTFMSEQGAGVECRIRFEIGAERREFDGPDAVPEDLRRLLPANLFLATRAVQIAKKVLFLGGDAELQEYLGSFLQANGYVLGSEADEKVSLVVMSGLPAGDDAAAKVRGARESRNGARFVVVTKRPLAAPEKESLTAAGVGAILREPFSLVEAFKAIQAG